VCVCVCVCICVCVCRYMTSERSLNLKDTSRHKEWVRERGHDIEERVRESEERARASESKETAREIEEEGSAVSLGEFVSSLARLSRV
jgi:hypothetical protein